MHMLTPNQNRAGPDTQDTLVQSFGSVSRETSTSMAPMIESSRTSGRSREYSWWNRLAISHAAAKSLKASG